MCWECHDDAADEAIERERIAGALSREHGEHLRCYRIGLVSGECDWIVARSVQDAAAIWQQRTGARPSDVFGEPTSSVVVAEHALALVGPQQRYSAEVARTRGRGWV